MNNLLIGVIAEDESDFECVKIFTRKLLPTKQIGFKKFIGHGCGKISRKANAWAVQFKRMKCNSIILIHDLDRNDIRTLTSKITTAFLPSPIQKYIISIPIEELEAWLLADHEAIMTTFSINSNLNISQHPEKIHSPKEFLRDLISRSTMKRHVYLNTVHNKKIAEKIDLQMVLRRCPSFNSLHNFIKSL